MTDRAGSGTFVEQPSDLATPPPAEVGRHGAAWRLAALTLPALVGCQFLLIGLLIAEPRNLPAPLLWAGEQVLSPWFTQDWRLFAPVPDVHDYQVYARAAYRDGDRRVQTPWLSLMDPLVEAIQANRLAPEAVRLEIAHKAALFSLRAGRPLVLTHLGREALAERWSSVERQPGSVVLLERLASVMLEDAYPGQQFETVQLMVTARPVVTVGGVSPDDGELGILLEPVPFQQVGR